MRGPSRGSGNGRREMGCARRSLPRARRTRPDPPSQQRGARDALRLTNSVCSESPAEKALCGSVPRCERSVCDEAIQIVAPSRLDCSTECIIGRAFARSRRPFGVLPDRNRSGRCRPDPPSWGSGWPLLAGDLVVDALNVEVHTEQLDIGELVAALAFNFPTVLPHDRAFERKQFAFGDGGL